MIHLKLKQERIAEKHQALVAINGDFYGFRDYDLETIAGRNPRTAIGMIEPLHYVYWLVGSILMVLAGITGIHNDKED